MADSLHEQILTALMDLLGAISESDGYAFTTRAVYDYKPNTATVKSDRVMPAIWVWSEQVDSSDEIYLGGVYNDVQLVVAFLDREGHDHQKRGIAMSAAIKKCLLKPQGITVGGAVVNIKPGKTEILVGEVDEEHAGGVCEFSVRYTHQFNDPSVAF